MKRYTQEEFDALPIVDGIRQCQPGDYSTVCNFGERCSFGDWCSFGEGCSFGDWCRFGEWCSFGGRCSFGEWCSFGERCSFGEGCSFEDGHECKPGDPYLAIDRAGSEQRKTYFFNFKDGIHVRAGCFFGPLAEFRAQVVETHGTSVYARQYLAFADIAEMTFDAREGE